jgi:hypothetical protein
LRQVAVNQRAVIPSTTWPVHMRCHNNCARCLCICVRLNTFNSRSTRLPVQVPVPFEDPAVCHIGCGGTAIKHHTSAPVKCLPIDGVCLGKTLQSYRVYAWTTEAVAIGVSEADKRRNWGQQTARCYFTCPMHTTNGMPSGRQLCEDSFDHVIQYLVTVRKEYEADPLLKQFKGTKRLI